MSGHKSNQERWLLTYSDLITLLMVFFVVMYAISEADKSKFLQLRTSMQRAFVGEASEESGPSLLDAQGQGAPLQDGEAAGDAPIVSGSPTAVVDAGVMLDELRAAILPLAAAQDVGDSVSVHAVPEGVVVSLSGNLLFDSGKAELRPEGVIFLHVLAQTVHAWPNQLTVEGHTDDVPISTPLYPSNWELSAARATVAARYLVEQERLAPERVGVAAYGEFRPVADNARREGRARNRRVDVVVFNATEEVETRR